MKYYFFAAISTNHSHTSFCKIIDTSYKTTYRPFPDFTISFIWCNACCITSAIPTSRPIQMSGLIILQMFLYHVIQLHLGYHAPV